MGNRNMRMRKGNMGMVSMGMGEEDVGNGNMRMGEGNMGM
jgi:hypothetical protein